MYKVVFRNIIFLVCAGTMIACNAPQRKKSDVNTAFGEYTENGIEPDGATEITNPDEYRLALERLDPGELASLSTAGNLLRNSQVDSITRDSLFVIFNDFYISFAANYSENNESVSAQLEGRKDLNSLKTNLASHGIRMVPAEGTLSLEPELDFLSKNFGEGLSAAYREFLTIRTKEQQVPFAGDGVMLISVDSLASRILEWENFIALYPDFIALRIAQDQYANYLAAFLAGLENTRVFQAETNRLNNSAKKVFETFIEKNQTSTSAGIVKSYLDMLQTTNFNYTEKVDSFLLERVYQ